MNKSSKARTELKLQSYFVNPLHRGWGLCLVGFQQGKYGELARKKLGELPGCYIGKKYYIPDVMRM